MKQPGCPQASGENVCALPKSLHAAPETTVEIGESPRARIPEVLPLQYAPERLDGVEFRRVTRETAPLLRAGFRLLCAPAEAVEDVPKNFSPKKDPGSPRGLHPAIWRRYFPTLERARGLTTQLWSSSASSSVISPAVTWLCTSASVSCATFFT